MNFKELRQQSGMTQKGFAEYFNIPKRTIEDWDSEKRPCPQYLLELMEYKLKHEGIIRVFIDQSVEDELKKSDEERWKIIKATSYLGNLSPEEFSKRVKEFGKHRKSKKTEE
jgi:transcriptional regulator with XRE-family HTH domain